MTQHSKQDATHNHYYHGFGINIAINVVNYFQHVMEAILKVYSSSSLCLVRTIFQRFWGKWRKKTIIYTFSTYFVLTQCIPFLSCQSSKRRSAAKGGQTPSKALSAFSKGINVESWQENRHMRSWLKSLWKNHVNYDKEGKETRRHGMKEYS